MIAMANKAVVAGILAALLLGAGGCSREQSDWEKARNANTTDSYELFVKKYPTGSFTSQAQANLKELYEQRDYQKARDIDTPEAYQAFLRQYPEGKFTEEARIRLENFTLAQAPSGAPGDATGSAGTGSPAAAPAGAGSTPAASQPAPEPPTPASAPTTAPKAAATGAAQGAQGGGGMRAASRKEARGYTIQLGAFKAGKSAASAHWATLEKSYPSLLKGLAPKIRASQTAGGRLFRLQVASLSHARAHSICKHLEAKAQACIVLPHTAH